MESLANVMTGLKVGVSNGPQWSVEVLAGAHRMSVEEMTALWRGAGLSPPTEESRLLKFRASTVLIQELRRRSDDRRAAVIERAVNRAWSTTQLEGLAEKRPAMDDLLRLIKHDRLRAFAERFEPNRHGGALLLGPTGIGKSVAVLCLMLRSMVNEAKDSFDAELSVPFTELTELRPPKSWASYDARDLGTAMQRNGLSDGDPSIIARAKMSDRFILEDLGWERSFHIEALLDIAAPRYKRGRPSFVTSGEHHEALRERYTDAVLRRFWNVDGKDGAIIDCWSAP